eukprot:s192_g3.t1
MIVFQDAYVAFAECGSPHFGAPRMRTSAGAGPRLSPGWRCALALRTAGRPGDGGAAARGGGAAAFGLGAFCACGGTGKGALLGTGAAPFPFPFAAFGSWGSLKLFEGATWGNDMF